MTSPGDSKALFDRFSVDFSKKYGEGGYGATFAATEKATGEALAVKLIDMRKMRPDAIKKECQILDVLKHPNVIAVRGHGVGLNQYANVYFIFMELASGGELFDKVIDGPMSEQVARNYFVQLLEGVAYLHAAGVAHRDLKLENVLLTGSAVVKLIDFGLSHVYARLPDGQIDTSKPLRDLCGSKSYAAPEVLGKRGYQGFTADMWSLGVCLFAMLSGFFPLDEASTVDWRFGKLEEGQRAGRSTVKSVYGWYKRSADHLTREVVDLLDHMLQIDPARRMTMEQLRVHPWVHEKVFDQGSYNQHEEFLGDEPQYRGIGMMPSNFEADTMMDEDDMPVYRSLGGATEAQELAPVPGLKRQHGFNADLDLGGGGGFALP